MKNLKSLTDEMLVKRYEQGCNSSFEVLLCRHKDRLYNYIFGVTHNRDVTEDIFQDTFIKAITTIRQHRYVESGKFFAWLSRIAHNLIIDYFRREDISNILPTNENEDYNSQNNSKLIDETCDSLTYEYALQDLEKLIDFLPECQQRIVRMRFYNDLSFKKIAELENISINTALGRMRYAILNLRKIADERNVIANFEQSI